MDDKKKLRAILFYQRSRAFPRNNELKMKLLVRYCAANHYSIYEDHSPYLNEARHDIMQHIFTCMSQKIFDVFITYSLDDLAQSPEELLKYLSEIYQSGIHFVSIKEDLNTRYFDSKEMLRLATILLEFKNKRTSEKTKERIALAVKIAKEEGRQLGVRGKDKVKRKEATFKFPFRN